MDRATMDAYTRILREELVCAMGCTEPIAIAYAAALARETLGCLPDTVDLSVSPNIIKNVKSVVVSRVVLARADLGRTSARYPHPRGDGGA